MLATLYLKAVLTVVASAFVNRIRGGGFGGQYLPSRPLFWAAPLMGLLAYWMTEEVRFSVAFGLAYLIWAWLAWGLWFDLGRMPDGYREIPRPKTRFERFIESISFGSDHIALFWRHAIMFTVGWIVAAFVVVFGSGIVELWDNTSLWDNVQLSAWAATAAALGVAPFAAIAGLVFGVVVTALYEIAWRLVPKEKGNPILPAEMMTGAFWGVLIISASPIVRLITNIGG